MRILVVEDDVLIAACLTTALERLGHTVLGPAHSSAGAHQMVQIQAPELAFLDVGLESQHAGVSLARELCAQYPLVVVFTTTQADVARANADCSIGLLVKPYDVSELAAVVSYAQLRLHKVCPQPPLHFASFEPFDEQRVSSG